VNVYECPRCLGAMNEPDANMFGHCRGCASPSDIIVLVAETGLGNVDPYELSDRWASEDQLAAQYRLTQ
jgi:hypothetical protein